jgi:hypothetical protein
MIFLFHGLIILMKMWSRIIYIILFIMILSLHLISVETLCSCTDCSLFILLPSPLYIYLSNYSPRYSSEHDYLQYMIVTFWIALIQKKKGETCNADPKIYINRDELVKLLDG